MRRKAEILKYKNNASSSKTNDLTKSQRWAALVRGTGQLSSYPQLTGYVQNASGGYDQYINKITTVVATGCDAKPTPTSSCDVPGPIMNLYLDATIPLYNYATNVDAYSELNNESIAPWTTFIKNDILCSTSSESELMVLNIRRFISQSYYNYTIQVPIAMYISGTGTGITSPVLILQNTLQLGSPTVSVYYNDALVTLPQSYQTSITQSGSGNLKFTISIPYPNNTDTTFSVVAYAGVLTISNLVLNTSPGFIYDIKVTFPVTFTPGSESTDTHDYYTTFGTTPTWGVLCNTSSNNASVTKQASITQSATVPTIYPTFSFSGV
jgi:hypothetical protein